MPSHSTCHYRVSNRLRLIGGLLCLLATHARSRAEFPEALDRVGRYCGCGWGDGYHACHGSGLRPLANLPPKSYSARVGTMQEKFDGCPTCRPQRLPCVDPIGMRGPETFYDRFDRYAMAISHHHANRYGAPSQAIVDPEEHMYPARREYRHTQSPRFGSPNPMVSPDHASLYPQTATEHSPKHLQDELTPEEIQAFRDYRRMQEQKAKFEKYLIEPEDIEPSQVFGGPPVGTAERRRLDEAKIRQRNQLQRRPRATAPREDDLPSPSDQPFRDRPMDEYLPQFPAPEFPAPATNDTRGDESLPTRGSLPTPTRSNESLPAPIERSRELQPGGQRGLPETIPAGPSERLPSASTRKRVTQPRQAMPADPVINLDRIRIPEAQLDLRGPAVGSIGPVIEREQPGQPTSRLAEVPDWRFVRQPR